MQNKKKDFLDLALESKMLTAPNVEPSVQPQPMIMIEGAPPDFKYSTTGEYSFGPGDNQNLKPQSVFQSNLDKAGDVKADEMALLGSQVSLALDRQEKSRKAYEDAVKSLVNKEQPDASQVIRDMRAMSQSRPQEFQVPEEDLFTKAIASLGPALAGLAVGGYAGYKGGGEGGEKSMALYGDQRKQDVANAARMAEERSKRMVGQSQLAQAEAKIMQEADQRELQKLEKVIGFLKEQGQQDTDLYKMAVTEYNKRLMGDKLIGAAKTTADFRQKEVDNEIDLEKANIAADAKKSAAVKSSQSRDKKDAAALRKEFNNRKETKTFVDIESAYNSLAQTQPSAAGDIKLIFNYMKILDPTSVVREGEFANAEKAAGVPDYIRNQYNKLIDGQRLTEKQRNDFKTQAQQAYQSQKQIFDNVSNEYAGYARDYGLDPVQVIGRKKIEQKPINSQPSEVVVKGTKYILQPNGKYLPEKK